MRTDPSTGLITLKPPGKGSGKRKGNTENTAMLSAFIL